MGAFWERRSRPRGGARVHHDQHHDDDHHNHHDNHHHNYHNDCRYLVRLAGERRYHNVNIMWE